MDEEQKKAFEKMLEEAGQKATKSASEGASKAASEAATVAVKSVQENLEKKIGEQGAEIQKIGETLVKLSKNVEVSMADVGASEKEIKHMKTLKSKALMFRGMVTNNWSGAEEQKAMADAVKQKAIEAGDQASGGYVLPVEMSADIVRLVRERAVFAELGCTMVSPSRAQFNIPKVTGGVTAYMVGEGKAITESDMKFGLIQLAPKKAAALVYASREMIDAADPGIVELIQSDMANSLVEMQMTQALYGNGGANQVVGLYNQDGITKLATAAGGDDPTSAFMRQLRSQVNQKYKTGSFKFLANENTVLKMSALIAASAPDASVLLTDEQRARSAFGKDFVSSGLVRDTKSKGGTNRLSEVFYGNWENFVVANWWGGMRIDSSTQGGVAWAQDMYSFRAILPFDFGVRDAAQFAIGDYIKTINS